MEEQNLTMKLRGIVGQHKFSVIVGILILMTLVASPIYLTHSRDNNQNEVKLDKRIYSSDFHPYQLSIPSNNKSANFVIPNNFFKTAQPTYAARSDSLTLTAINADSKTKEVLARIMLIAVPKKDGIDSEQIQKDLADPQSTQFQSFMAPIGGQLSYNYTLQYVSVSTYSSKNIGSNLWRIDFNAIPKSNSPITLYRGSILVAYGEDSIYYFAVESTDFNWTPNINTWNKVLASLAIDQ